MPTDSMGGATYAGRPPDGPLPAQDDPNVTREAGAPLSATRRALATAIEVSGPSPGNPWSTPATCTTYSMVLKAGRYTLEAWGGIGGYEGNEAKSQGGYSKADLTLDQETTIFAVAGGNGKVATGQWSLAAGGCNGGGNGLAYVIGGFYFGGGGGASHVAAVENDLRYRILVAGGSGGSYNGPVSKGGKGGGEYGENGPNGYSGKGATQHGPGNGCVSGSGCIAGNFGNGGSAKSQYGCGGGGGWFGGAGSYGDITGGGGGSGFIFEGKNETGCSEIDDHPLIGIIAPLKNISSQVGQSYNGGKVTITLIGAMTTASASASLKPPTKILNYAFKCNLIFSHIITGPIFQENLLMPKGKSDKKYG